MDNYKVHINKYNVVNISFNEITDNMKSYEEYINNIINELKKEVINRFNIEEIYSAMIVLGFLFYHDGYLKIPNKELMKEFEKALKDKSFGYVYEIIENSRKML